MQLQRAGRGKAFRSGLLPGSLISELQRYSSQPIGILQLLPWHAVLLVCANEVSLTPAQDTRCRKHSANARYTKQDFFPENFLRRMHFVYSQSWEVVHSSVGHVHSAPCGMNVESAFRSTWPAHLKPHVRPYTPGDN